MPAQTDTEKSLNFTKEEGLKIQKEQLAKYKAVLIPKAYEKLEAEVKKNNETAIDGFDIMRGVDIDAILFDRVIPLFIGS